MKTDPNMQYLTHHPTPSTSSFFAIIMICFDS